jgi:signal transduction histidine kinase
MFTCTDLIFMKILSIKISIILIYQQDTSPFFITFYIYGYAILIGVLFARNKEKIDYERFHTIKMFAGAVAHEMRTPILGIALKANRLKVAIPVLIEAYKRSLKANLESQILSEEDLSIINETPEEIQKTTRQAFGFIDTTLLNLKEDFKDSPKASCSIKTCLEDALNDYNLSDREKSFIHLNLENDFEFQGNPELMKHVFFNLLKNSIYYVKAANKGEIIIKTNVNGDHHTLSFKDTGTGIAPDILPHIFDKFYSRTKYGAGIGLAFCKAVMKGLGGDVTCKSQYGEYTEFILTFPSS